MEILIASGKLVLIGFCLGVGFWGSQKLTHQIEKWLIVSHNHI